MHGSALPRPNLQRPFIHLGTSQGTRPSYHRRAIVGNGKMSTPSPQMKLL
ncbi:hypothetical protein RSAG8_06344, partial [Rhizoctonia solani AG-8 WAC10335]